MNHKGFQISEYSVFLFLVQPKIFTIRENHLDQSAPKGASFQLRNCIKDAKCRLLFWNGVFRTLTVGIKSMGSLWVWHSR